MMTRVLVVASLLLIALTTTTLAKSPTNNRPIWGVLTQPTSGDMAQFGTSAINADYVKFLEMAGARVVPVHFDGSSCELLGIFLCINGLLFPGGGDILNHTQYFSAAQDLWELALNANKKGDYFPIHGTCLGLQLETVLLNQGDVSILTHFDAENISLPLQFNGNYPPAQSRMFGALSQEQLQALASQPLTENYHHYGVSYDGAWQQNQAGLQDFFNLIATSADREGKQFVAQWEAKDYPIYGTQWHPERSLFEWDPYEQINHSPTAVRIMQLVADFLVDESRRSTHSFDSQLAEMDALIYNYQPVYTGKLIGNDEQFYFFNTSDKDPRRQRMMRALGCA